MLYQKLLTGSKPYFINLEKQLTFESHRHPEIEINYCLKGSYDIIIDGKIHTMNEGYMAIIGSLVPHSFPPSSNILSLTIEVGPIFLKEYFSQFSKCEFAPIYCLNITDSTNDYAKKLKILFSEIIQTYDINSDYSRLSLLGNLYNICDCIYRNICSHEKLTTKQRTDYMIYTNIEKALNYIHAHYAENITLEDAANLTGYGKSNFSKHFKNITGDTFHHYLNRYRVELVQYFLFETHYSLAEIASLTGFADTKILCRVFKSFTGITPGKYRKC